MSKTPGPRRRLIWVLGLQVAAVAALVATGAYRPGGNGSTRAVAAAPGAAPAQAAPVTTPAITQTPTLPDMPAAVTLGAEAGDLAVGLFANQLGSNTVELAAVVLGGDGLAANGLRLTFDAQGSSGATRASSKPCGGGCYETRVNIGKPDRVTVRIERSSRAPVSATFALPAEWPTASAAALVDRASQTFRGLHNVAYDETLASDPKHSISTHWELEAPNKLSYQIAGGAAGVVIGNRRWDRATSDGRWQRSQQTPLRLPSPPWSGQPLHARILGRTEVGGRPAVVVSFLTNGAAPAWFTLWLDAADTRLVEMRMTTTAHFMHQRFTEFNTVPPIEPPQ